MKLLLQQLAHSEGLFLIDTQDQHSLSAIDVRARLGRLLQGKKFGQRAPAVAVDDRMLMCGETLPLEDPLSRMVGGGFVPKRRDQRLLQCCGHFESRTFALAGFTGCERSLAVQTPTIEPPRILPETVDRRLYRLIHGLPHSPVGDRYVTILSDLGEGLGWVGAGLALAWLGGSRGRRAGLAAAVASLGTTYLVQRLIKPVFRRNRPHVGRDVLVVGIRTTDASFPSGHAASSFAAATAIAAFYPAVSPLVFGLASGVAVSRVHLGHHFPSDVAVGGFIGIATGSCVAALMKMARTF